MPEHIETELKLKLLNPFGSADGWQEFWACQIIRGFAEQVTWTSLQMEACYYDTPGQALQKAGIAYRVRREGANWVATVKRGGTSGGGLHQREEWNVPTDSSEPRPELFADLPVGPLLSAAIGEEQLIRVFSTNFERRAAEVVFQDARIEIAADEGYILAGEKTEPIREIELELKNGEPVALLRLGAAIAQEIPLAPEPKSKYYRALLLAGLAEPQPQATALTLTGQETVAEGLTALLAAAISSVFIAYQDFLDDPAEPEHTHQLRVKLRRLRSLLVFAKPRIGDDDYQNWKQALGQWVGVFGPLRDLDVLAAAWEELCQSPYIAFDSKPWLGENISKRRNAELDKVLETVRQTRICAMLLNLWAWTQDKPWQEGEHATISAYVRWRVGDWLAVALDSGKTMDWDDEKALHTLRLTMKRVRYVLSALPFCLDRRTELLLLKLQEMQDLFGVLTDRAVAGKLLAGLARGATRAVYRDIGILTGWQGHNELFIRIRLPRQWKKFKRSARRWLAV